MKSHTVTKGNAKLLLLVKNILQEEKFLLLTTGKQMNKNPWGGGNFRDILKIVQVN